MAMQHYFSFLVAIACLVGPVFMQAGSGSIMDMYNGMLFNQVRGHFGRVACGTD
jgi:hypothetical protein